MATHTKNAMDCFAEVFESIHLICFYSMNEQEFYHKIIVD